MIDIPRWDFDWQQGYAFLPGEEVIVQPGEALRVECTYDNSAANQPVVNGEQLEPRDVRWGDGTLDEMCLNTLVLVEPYAPVEEPEAICEGFQSCYDSCGIPGYPRSACVLACGAGNGCAECLLTGIVPCTSGSCGPLAQEMLDCFEGCDFDGGCIGSSCSGSIVAFDACAWPMVAAGECDSDIAVCSVSL